MLIGTDFKPLPPSDILERLQNIDPGLGLMYINGMHTWAVTWKWKMMDPRRELVQKGLLAPDSDFDIYAYIPEDCPVDQAFGYIERAFVRNTGREHTRYLLDRLEKYNKQREDDVLKPTLELAEELLETNAKTLFKDKNIPRTKAPKSSKSTDEKKYQEFLHEGSL